MTDNEKKFYTFWKNNIKGKTQLQMSLITESFSYLYGVQYNGGTCGSCIRNVGIDLKKIYERLEGEITIENDVNETLSNMKIPTNDEHNKLMETLVKNENKKNEKNKRKSRYE